MYPRSPRKAFPMSRHTMRSPFPPPKPRAPVRATRRNPQPTPRNQQASYCRRRPQIFFVRSASIVLLSLHPHTLSPCAFLFARLHQCFYQCSSAFISGAFDLPHAVPTVVSACETALSRKRASRPSFPLAPLSNSLIFLHLHKHRKEPHVP